MSHKSVKHVIADAGAFIRNAPLQSIGEHIYTIPEVVKEIKDKATLQRLQVLPYKIEYRTPSQESLQIVSNFSKKTGDYKSLSAVDIKVMALTYQLEKEHVGSEHIKTVPERKIEWNATTKMLEKPTDIAGFYLSKTKSAGNSRTTSVSEKSTQSSLPKESLDQESCDTVKRNNESDLHNESDDNRSNQENSEPDLKENVTVQIKDAKDINNSDLSESTNVSENLDNVQDKEEVQAFPSEGEIIQGTLLEGDSEEEEEPSDEDDSDDDDDGWITPCNIQEVKQKMGEVPSEEADVMVGCLTMDFAIQNVLIQMGLNVISVDGLLIKRAKSYVLRCSACMKVTTNVLKEFCPFCGNNALRKVSMIVEEDGSIRYFLSRRKPANTRGLKYALPLPKGGKHSQNPILCADQPFPQQRTTKKSKQKLDVFDPDYVAGYSPFAVTDITSRASQLGIRSGRTGQFNKRNPNEVRKNYGRRK
ncbi:RNA-binding protein NOB1-like [Mytilus californianus]|uniref:RNA-binding protein NOB1-like n=1 Tax=Mytilus californianus TaxID=6549 RepID=UPI00224535C8|nr:RNA-binding protein NOB1-like [Mytilus californianus]